MKSIIVLILFVVYSFSFCNLLNGVTLFSVSSGIGNSNTYVINNDYDIINQWDHELSTIGVPHLNNDGSIILQFRSLEHSFGNSHGPIGGIFTKLDWLGNEVWSNEFFSNTFHPHHDFEVMPNGNILIFGWEKKTYSEAINAGRLNVENEIWPLVIYEVTINQNTEFDIIWEWHIWDHLVQDIDSSLPNFGIIKDHPELIDINIGDFTNPNEGDWLHTNAIAYNSDLDQIVFSSKHFNEIFIIDHSTTILEASGHNGGNSNKGGDILYRWGSPANYGRGDNSDQKLNAQHGAHWIPLGYPGAGKLLIFNNNPSDTLSNSNQFGNSSVVEILPPVNDDSNYFLTVDSIFGPEEYDIIYGDDDSFFSSFQSGAYRLKNGNTIITVTQEKFIFEINQNNQVVWECKIDSLINENGFTARAKKYNINYLDSIIGDIYTDNKLNVYDVIRTADIISENQFLEKSDLNDDGLVSEEDINMLLNFIFN